ncbi:unnamed protein product [Polarella glacialis]|uniref:Uncharacterized protein n=1 Tax=Polarella glacialis TaxID=89957 RepID=A0A813FQ74_POLGL|nr:unnamed protein product [Polarella glacialis]
MEGVSEEQDVLEEVRSAFRCWLGENKRLDNYRLVARETEAFVAGLRRASRSVISSLPAIPCAPAPDAMERLAGAKAEPSPEGPATDYRAECPKRVSDLSGGSNIPATDAASAAPQENGRPNSSSSVSQVNAARVEPSPPAPQVQTGIVVLKLTFGNGARLRSSWRCSLGRAQVEPLTGESHEVGSSEWQVDLLIGLQMPGEHSEVPLAEFYGRRSLDLRIDESKYLVDHPLVTRLQEALLPSLPKAIVFLDALLAMPLATPGGGPVPFRLRILEDMLDQECWAEESDSEILEDLTLDDDDPHEDSEEDQRPQQAPPQDLRHSAGQASGRRKVARRCLTAAGEQKHCCPS